MSQKRYINFGDTVLSSRINALATAIVSPGVLEGANLSVGLNNNSIDVSPSKVMLNDLLLVEDSTTTLLLGEAPAYSLPAEKKDYTVVYEHADQQVQGGVPAVLLLIEGLFTFDALENTVVLGWVRYPGGSVPVAQEMLIEAPKLKLRNPTTSSASVSTPPFKKYIQEEHPTPGAITTTEVYDTVNTRAYTLLTNTAFAVNTITLVFPLIAEAVPPNRLLLEANVGLASSITASIMAEDGTVFAAEDNVILNTGGAFEFHELIVSQLDRTKFQQNRPYFVHLEIQLNPASQVMISLIGASSNPLPF